MSKFSLAICSALVALACTNTVAAQQAAPVYLYQFGYKSEVTLPGTDYALGTPHAMDITFKFNNETPENGPSVLAGNHPDRFVASRKMAELWTTFARTGKPANGRPAARSGPRPDAARADGSRANPPRNGGDRAPAGARPARPAGNAPRRNDAPRAALFSAKSGSGER